MFADGTLKERTFTKHENNLNFFFGWRTTFQGFALLGNCCCVRPGQLKPINDLKLMIKSEVEF